MKRGFTLIEMMVAMSIFAIVMLVGVGALLSLVQANTRAQAINSVINNLNAAIENMSRTIRVGTVYHCETSPTPPSAATLATPQDCAAGGGVLFAFESSSGDSRGS
ncbi:type II secretion system protein [Candidatus Kaiserbacteria bacterium]|nr:type II secretion system protein [Candidatus Kaiserbacteria bacterium]